MLLPSSAAPLVTIGLSDGRDTGRNGYAAPPFRQLHARTIDEQQPDPAPAPSSSLPSLPPGGSRLPCHQLWSILDIWRARENGRTCAEVVKMDAYEGAQTTQPLTKLARITAGQTVQTLDSTSEPPPMPPRRCCRPFKIASV